MPRGGRRPGAGAPKGNLNALKEGHYSRLYRIAQAMAAVPEVRDALLAYRRQMLHRERQASAMAFALILDFLRQNNQTGSRIRNPTPQTPSNFITPETIKQP